jgi:SM-20-related protein
MLDRVTDRLLHVQDNILSEAQRVEVNEYLHSDGWKFGWKSRGKKDTFAFWHRHFAGYKLSGGDASAYDCEYELEPFPVIRKVWHLLAAELPPGHRLIRCYANGSTYGSDGTLHRDTKLENTYTTVYYPHDSWDPDWGGETVFFNQARDDIIASVYPRPNRLVIFDGRIPNVARGVSRLCPALRVTLMFKTDVTDAG